jgi:two-component system, OmpR family, response regulator
VTVDQATVFVLEDDLEMRSLLVRGLREEGFRVEGTGLGSQLLESLAARQPDLLVIDIGLPDADGRDVCQALRARGVTAPVLFLTARSGLADRLASFSAGGDDFLSKPFAFEELVARLQALLRRAGGQSATVVGHLELDPGAHVARAGDTAVALTPTEFRILARLGASPGAAVRRRLLVEAAWPYGAIVQDNTLDTYIARLRRKLAALPDAPGIRTVHGVGYSLE